jgi:hypothetical protein
MAIGFAFLARSRRILPMLLSLVCLLAPAQAQHGGGGGHSGGGHFGGGHSSGSHSRGSRTGGHFGWLRFGFGKHSARHIESSASSTSNTSPVAPSRLRNISTPARAPSRIPSTFLWSRPLSANSPERNGFIDSSALRRDRLFLHHRFRRFPSSGCFLNGINQICFFEPFLPLFGFYAGFDLFYIGFDGDLDDGVDSQDLMQPEMSTITPSSNLSDEDPAKGNSSTSAQAALGAARGNQALDNGVFLLVLKDGTTHAVIDYWVADDYLEYVSPDGTRSHIPLETLDLQNTVSQNATRRLPFVLRFAPEQDR